MKRHAIVVFVLALLVLVASCVHGDPYTPDLACQRNVVWDTTAVIDSTTYTIRACIQ